MDKRKQYASEAQRTKFLELYAQGKITRETLEQYERGSLGKKLPKRLKKKGEK